MSLSRGSDAPRQKNVIVGLTPREAVRLVTDCADFRLLQPQSVRRLGDLLSRFASYVEQGHACGSLADVSSDHVRRFIFSLRDGASPTPPAPATMHLRRSAVRLFFRLARRLGLVERDPTFDITLPPRSSLAQRPLTDDEVLLCRSHSLRTLTETRQPAAWAIAEAGARSSEIPLIRVSHVDLQAGRVFISGSTRTRPRWGHATDWGVAQLELRLRSMGGTGGDPPVAYAGTAGEESAQASSCSAISSVLTRAGLSKEPDIGPGSVAAWAGARALADGKGIDWVARMLGVRSLDRAARLVGWNWLKEA